MVIFQGCPQLGKKKRGQMPPSNKDFSEDCSELQKTTLELVLTPPIVPYLEFECRRCLYGKEFHSWVIPNPVVIPNFGSEPEVFPRVYTFLPSFLNVFSHHLVKKYIATSVITEGGAPYKIVFKWRSVIGV